MEKISGIIPASARTRSVDVSTSQPVRPGAPTYGRPVGRVTRAPLEVQDRVSVSTAERALEQYQQPATSYRNRVEARRAQIAEQTAKNFFGPGFADPMKGTAETASGSAFEPVDLSDVRAIEDLPDEV